MSDRILFLDFDGVINSREWRESGGFRSIGPFDPNLVDRVNRIVDATGADTVISSAWRIGRKLDELRDLLRDHGFAGTVIDATDSRRHEYPQRGDCILAWVEKHDVDEYVVLDDSSDMDRVPDHRFVQTDYREGIQPCHVDQAIRALGVDSDLRSLAAREALTEEDLQ